MNDASDVSTLPQSRRHFSLKQKAEHVERYLQSGLSMAEFCRQTHLPASCLQSWLDLVEPYDPSEPSAPENPPVFQEVTLPTSSITAQWAVELTRSNGSVLRLAQPLSPQLLEQLLRLC
jgi:transposase-like protein